MKCLFGKLRTRVSVFSDAGMLGGLAMDTLVETNLEIDTLKMEVAYQRLLH